MERINNDELVLNVSKSIINNNWDENFYYHFIKYLTKGRKYQEEAILTTLRYFLGGKYKNIENLVDENWKNGEKRVYIISIKL